MNKILFSRRRPTLSHRFHKEFGCPMILRWSVVLLHCEETMLQESVSRLPQLMTDLSDAKAQKKLYSKPKCRGLEEIAASADSEALKSKSTPAFWTTPTHGGAATKCGACAAKPAADFLMRAGECNRHPWSREISHMMILADALQRSCGSDYTPRLNERRATESCRP
jgi:hypothetical protein